MARRRDRRAKLTGSLLGFSQAVRVFRKPRQSDPQQLGRRANFGVSGRRFRFKPAGGFGRNRQAVSVQSGTLLRRGFGAARFQTAWADAYSAQRFRRDAGMIRKKLIEVD